MTYPISKEEIELFMSEGAEAYKAKLMLEDCPYSKYNYKARLWIRGYANAAYGSHNLLK